MFDVFLIAHAPDRRTAGLNDEVAVDAGTIGGQVVAVRVGTAVLGSAPKEGVTGIVVTAGVEASG